MMMSTPVITHQNFNITQPPKPMVYFQKENTRRPSQSTSTELSQGDKLAIAARSKPSAPPRRMLGGGLIPANGGELEAPLPQTGRQSSFKQMQEGATRVLMTIKSNVEASFKLTARPSSTPPPPPVTSIIPAIQRRRESLVSPNTGSGSGFSNNSGSVARHQQSTTSHPNQSVSELGVYDDEGTNDVVIQPYEPSARRILHNHRVRKESRVRRKPEGHLAPAARRTHKQRTQVQQKLLSPTKKPRAVRFNSGGVGSDEDLTTPANSLSVSKVTNSANFSVSPTPSFASASPVPLTMSLPMHSINDIPLSTVLRYQQSRDAFMAHLKFEFSESNLAFWEAVQSFNERCAWDGCDWEEASNIHRQFLMPGSPDWVNVSSSTLSNVVDALRSPLTLTPQLFVAAQNETYDLMSRDAFARFRETDMGQKVLEWLLTQQGIATMPLKLPMAVRRKSLRFVSGLLKRPQREKSGIDSAPVEAACSTTKSDSSFDNEKGVDSPLNERHVKTPTTTYTQLQEVPLPPQPNSRASNPPPQQDHGHSEEPQPPALLATTTPSDGVETNAADGPGSEDDDQPSVNADSGLRSDRTGESRVTAASPPSVRSKNTSRGSASKLNRETSTASITSARVEMVDFALKSMFEISDKQTNLRKLRQRSMKRLREEPNSKPQIQFPLSGTTVASIVAALTAAQPSPVPSSRRGSRPGPLPGPLGHLAEDPRRPVPALQRSGSARTMQEGGLVRRPSRPKQPTATVVERSNSMQHLTHKRAT